MVIERCTILLFLFFPNSIISNSDLRSGLGRILNSTCQDKLEDLNVKELYI